MGALTGNTISSSYLGLLKTSDNAILDSSLRLIEDGGGTDASIKLSTTQLGLSDGSNTVPSLTFSSNSDTGFYYDSDITYYTLNGVSQLAIGSASLTLNNDSELRWGTSDVFIKGTTSTDNIQIGLQGATKLTLHQTNGLTLAQYGSGSITGTVTQRLGVTSSGQVVEIPIGGGAVDGSGTAGKIVKWSDSDTITDSIMSESGSTIEIAGGGGNGQLNLTRTSGVTLFNQAQASVGVIGTSTNHRLDFKSNSTTALTIDTSQRVGIGTTSPVEVLDLKTASGDCRIRLDAPASSDTEIKFFNDGTAQYTIGHDDATDNFVIGGANVDAPLVSVDKSGNATFAGDVTISKDIPAIDLVDTNSDDDFRIRNNNGTFEIFDITNTGARFQVNSDGNSIVTGSLTVGDGSGSEIPLTFNSSATDFALGANGSNFMIGTSTDLDSGNLVTLSSAGNLGLGTTSPTSDAIVKFIEIEDSTSAGLVLDAPRVFSIFSSSSSTLAFRDETAGATRMTLDSSGNVGIGTASPTSKLNVAGLNSSNFVDLTGSAPGASRAVRFIDGATQTKYNWLLGAQFNVDNVFEITPSTAVGGTTFSSPALKISAVSGDVTLGGGVSVQGGAVSLGTADTSSGHINCFENLTFNIDTDNDDTDRYFAFYTNGSSGSGSELMRLTEDGRLGIGVTGPSYDVQIGTYGTDADSSLALASTTDGTGTIRFGDGSSGTEANAGRITYNHSSNAMIFDTNGGTEALRIDSSGNIGIGKTPSTFRLEVESANESVALFEGSRDLGVMLTNSSADSLVNHMQFIGRNAANSYNALSFSAAIGNGLTIDTSNNVSIGLAGTSTIGAKLDVSNPSTSADTVAQFGNTNIQGGLQIQTNGNLEWGFNALNTRNLTFSTNQTEVMRIDSSQNVGIGTDTPATKFEVESTTNGEVARFVSSSGNSGSVTGSAFLGIDHFHNSTNPACLIGVTEESSASYRGDFEIKLKSTSADDAVPSTMFFIDASNGNIGIGNVSPDEKLQVSGTIHAKNLSNLGMTGTADGQLKVSGGAGSQYSFAVSVDDAGTYLYNNGSSRSMIFGTNETTRMTLSSGGLSIVGSISKGSGAFKIDHPLNSKKDTHNLVHSFVESPQADNIYRGKVKLVDGKAEINIDLVSNMTDGTFVELNRDIQCFTSNESDWDNVKGKVDGNILTIESQNPSSSSTISWLVIGERQDDKIYESDLTDDNGKIIVEPLKE